MAVTRSPADVTQILPQRNQAQTRPPDVPEVVCDMAVMARERVCQGGKLVWQTRSGRSHRQLPRHRPADNSLGRRILSAPQALGKHPPAMEGLTTTFAKCKYAPGAIRGGRPGLVGGSRACSGRS